MIIHKEGYGALIITFLVFAVIIGIIWLFFGVTLSHLQLQFYLRLFLFLLLIFSACPKELRLIDESSVISAADGKVVIIKEVEENEFLHSRCRQVSVFMGICNVHINYFPVSGKVLYYKHHWGNYLVAWHPKSSVKNERTSIAVETAGGKRIFLRQIAGYVARRIVCYAKENEHANQCDQLGFIKFGSRLDLFLPLDAEIKVNVGDKVTACQTVIAKL